MSENNSFADVWIRRSALNKIELWREISKDHENQWLITKNSFAQHFLASVRLQGSKKVRRDYFFASRRPDSSVITILGEEFYWTQASFNARDKLVQSMLAKQPNITDAKIIAKFKKIVVDEAFVKAKTHARNAESRKESESATRLANTFFIVLALIFLFFIKSCADSIDEAKNYDHPACKNLGLKSNWNNTECY
jgi:hypothetical protein